MHAIAIWVCREKSCHHRELVGDVQTIQHHQFPGGGAVRMPGATPAAWPTRRLYARNLDDFHGLDRLVDAVAVQSRTAKTVTRVSDSGEMVRPEIIGSPISLWGSLSCA
jgi:hypothetical protein